MTTVAVSDLKARLSEYLKRVQGGAEVLITDRGKPVARLVPVFRSKTTRESWIQMEKQGLIKIGSGKLPKHFWSLPTPEDPNGSVLNALVEERKEGR